MSNEAIKIFNGRGELVRTYTENESDDRASYKEKAQEFCDKNQGFTMNKPVISEKEPEVTDGGAPIEKADPLGGANKSGGNKKGNKK